MERRVGNDVVDLSDPTIATSHLRPRFIARVCAPEEQERLARAEDPKTLLWSLFAAKEASFKVVCKLGARPAVFSPREFVVSENLRSVRYAEWTLALAVEVVGSCVHAVASTFDEPLCHGVERLQGDPSTAARALLLHTLGAEWGTGLEVAREPLETSWDGLGPPRVTKHGAVLNLDVSLSHDGKFVAFAADTRRTVASLQRGNTEPAR